MRAMGRTARGPRYPPRPRASASSPASSPTRARRFSRQVSTATASVPRWQTSHSRARRPGRDRHADPRAQRRPRRRSGAATDEIMLISNQGTLVHARACGRSACARPQHPGRSPHQFRAGEDLVGVNGSRRTTRTKPTQKAMSVLKRRRTRTLPTQLPQAMKRRRRTPRRTRKTEPNRQEART